MSDDRQTCADQILKAIEYGKLPADEIQARLRQMIRDELSGAEQSDSGRLRVELCNSLLWQLYTHGEVRGLGADDDAMKARIEKGYARRRRRKRLMTRSMISLTTAVVLFVGLTAAGMIQPLRWFTGRSTEDEQQYIIEGHEVSSLPVSVAIANHVPNATRPRSLQATDDPDALIAFLGFDPGLPHTVAGVYTSCSFTGLIRERYTAMSCYYMKGSQPIDDPLVTIIIRYYHDANDAYISLEQSEEGEMISVGGIDVYRYRNYDIYGYMWTQENQVCTLSTTESPEIAEAFLEDFLRQRNAPPVQAPRSDIRSLQTTTDPYELITFLGFDPGLPQTVAGVYLVSYYRATIIEENITIISLGYMKEGQEEGNTEFKLYAYYYPDANDAYLSFEQSEEGELISLCGTQIYRYRNVDRNSYTWTRDAQVWSLTTKEPREAAEAFLEDFLCQRNALPEPQPSSDIRSLQTTDSDEVTAFLGCDPRFPVSLNAVYTPVRYTAQIDPEKIRAAAQYEPVDHTITDPPFLSIRLTCFNQQDGTRVEFQQDAEGEYVLIGGVSVYRYTNTWTCNYLWIEDRTIVKVLTDLPFEEADPLVEEIIKSRNGT